ncbi:hypothetical protein D9M68_687470 [compost metagenome]
MEHHTLLLVQAGEEAAHFQTQHTLQRHILGGHHVHLESARPQRCRRLHADKAGADQGHRRRALARFDDRPGIGQRAQHEHVGKVEAGDGKPPRFRTSRDEQDVIG